MKNPFSPSYKNLKAKSLPQLNNKRKIRVLCIDGGGIRGILPAVLLAKLEETIQKKTHNPKAKLIDYFDFVAGTSTGGILSCLYLVPDRKNPTQARYSAKKVLDLYMKKGGTVFRRSFWQKLNFLAGIFGNKFQTRNIKKMLHSTLGVKTLLKDFVKPSLIVAFDLGNEKPHLFTSIEAKKNPHKNFFAWEVARATSAAPSYFSPKKIRSLTGKEYVCIDGGVIANNPALCALTEVQKLNPAMIRNWPKDEKIKSEDIILVSVGTMESEKVNNPTSRKGLLSWIKPILSVRMMGDSKMIDYIVNQELNQKGVQQYFRIEPQICSADSGMDNATDKNMNLLYQDGLKNAEEHKDLLDRIADQLILQTGQEASEIIDMNSSENIKLRMAS